MATALAWHLTVALDLASLTFIAIAKPTLVKSYSAPWPYQNHDGNHNEFTAIHKDKHGVNSEFPQRGSYQAIEM